MPTRIPHRLSVCRSMPVMAAAVLAAVAGTPATQGAMFLNVQLSRQNDSSYSCFPFLSYFDPVIPGPPSSVPIVVQSGNGKHSGILNGTTQTSLFYSSREDLLAGASNPEGDAHPWTLTFGPNSEAPTVYTFGVDVRNLGTAEIPAELPRIEGLEPHWGGANGLSPIFTWNGLSGFTRLEIHLYDQQGAIGGGLLSADATSWNPAFALKPLSNYFVSLTYSRNETTGTAVIGSPTHDGNPLPYDWVAGVSLATTVTMNIETGAVPEPHWTAVGAGLLLAGFAWFRRRVG